MDIDGANEYGQAQILKNTVFTYQKYFIFVNAVSKILCLLYGTVCVHVHTHTHTHTHTWSDGHLRRVDAWADTGSTVSVFVGGGRSRDSCQRGGDVRRRGSSKRSRVPPTCSPR